MSAHEPDHVQTRPLWLGLWVSLASIALASGAALALLIAARGAARLDSDPHWYRALPPQVRELELYVFSGSADAERDEEQARARLASYGWVDRDAGVIHVPIETAIELYLSEQGRGEP